MKNTSDVLALKSSEMSASVLEIGVNERFCAERNINRSSSNWMHLTHRF